MIWWSLAQLVLAAILGFVGGRVSIWLDHRKPEWRVVPTGATDWPTASATPRVNTFIVTNLGGTAYNVTMAVNGGTLVRGIDRKTFEKGDDEVVNSPMQGDGHILISWTTKSGKAKGPASRFMAPKR